MSNVRNLKMNEIVMVDPSKMSDLFDVHGQIGAEVFVGRALETLSDAIGRVEDAYVEQDLKTLVHNAQKLVTVGDQLGMTSLASVSRDVVICAKAAEIIPLAATLGRLIRISEHSLTAIWDMENITL